MDKVPSPQNLRASCRSVAVFIREEGYPEAGVNSQIADATKAISRFDRWSMSRIEIFPELPGMTLSRSSSALAPLVR